MKYLKAFLYRTRKKAFLLSLKRVLLFFFIGGLVLSYYNSPFFVFADTSAPDPYADVVSLFVKYTGPKVTEPTIITKDLLSVTAVFDDNTTFTITDYTITSKVVLSTPGDYTITVSYGGKLASCNITYVDVTSKPLYQITFESNGGSEVIPIQNIKPGTTVSNLETPVRTGYWFRGWYLTETFSKEYDITTKINSDFTLYARWERKQYPTQDIMSAPLYYADGNAEITIDLAEQTYGPHVNLIVDTVNATSVKRAANIISETAPYFSFYLDVDDFTFSENSPLLTTISLPDFYTDKNICVFYTPNQVSISAAMQGDLNSVGEYEFYAYLPGTYIVMVYPETKATATPAPTKKPYIALQKISPLKINAQAFMDIRFYNFEDDTDGISFRWSSSKTSIATVNSNGVITGKKSGTTVITAKSRDGKLSASQTLTVYKQKTLAKKLTLSTKQKTLKKGATYQIKATVSPKNTTNSTLTYTSSKTNIATVSKSGKITAKKAGTCIITVKTKDGTNIKKQLKVIIKK